MALMQFADDAGTNQPGHKWSDLVLCCVLTESMDTLVYVNEQKMPSRLQTHMLIWTYIVPKCIRALRASFRDTTKQQQEHKCCLHSLEQHSIIMNIVFTLRIRTDRPEQSVHQH